MFDHHKSPGEVKMGGRMSDDLKMGLIALALIGGVCYFATEALGVTDLLIQQVRSLLHNLF